MDKIIFLIKKTRKAAVVKTLSAKGSRNIPTFVTDLNFLACQPSYQSVRVAIKKMIREYLTNNGLLLIAI